MANENGIGQAESRLESEGDVVASLSSKSLKEKSPGTAHPERVKVPYPQMI